MTVVDALKGLKKYIEREIAPSIKLQEENEEAGEVTFVNPYVEICHFPHKNFFPMKFRAPGILITIGEAPDDGDESTISVIIQCITYGGGFYKDESGNELKIPDAEGYLDLLNLMELIRQKLIERHVIEECAVIEKPITIGMYDTEIVWPYWYGYVKFDLSIQAGEFILQE